MCLFVFNLSRGLFHLVYLFIFLEGQIHKEVIEYSEALAIEDGDSNNNNDNETKNNSLSLVHWPL